MSEKKSNLSKLSPQDKAERTTHAANSIMREERQASDAKVAKLKALRLASLDPLPAPAVAEAPGTAPRKAARRPAVAALRSLALQGDNGPPAKRTKP